MWALKWHMQLPLDFIYQYWTFDPLYLAFSCFIFFFHASKLHSIQNLPVFLSVLQGVYCFWSFCKEIKDDEKLPIYIALMYFGNLVMVISS